jgi:hypothetical protein
LGRKNYSFLTEIANRLVNPLEYPGSLGFPFMVAMLLLTCYLTVSATSLRENS